MNRLKTAAARQKRVTYAPVPNRLRALRLEALSVLDERRPTRVADKRRWVQSYIALRA